MEQELVGIAARQNNTKRNYLVVNRLQGKHIPVSPFKAMQMFGELTEKIKECYGQKRLLLIGFAETATAIGAAAAADMDCCYMQTTREEIEGVEYLYFSESHSHATEQKLVRNDIDRIISGVDRILFIEDEVTTGNTIWNVIRVLEEKYGTGRFDFSVASLLNGMDEEAVRRFQGQGIGLHYLVKTDHSAYGEKAMKYAGDGICHDMTKGGVSVEYRSWDFDGRMDARRVVNSREYQAACSALSSRILNLTRKDPGKRILVLGTEEFMFPALHAALQIEETGKFVRFHATTRSPIAVSSEPDYPLHVRFELKSLYDSGRITYLYELNRYDSCYIITDAGADSPEGTGSLMNALQLSGIQQINLIRWC